MSFVALVSDSTAGIPEGYARQHNITVVPLYLKVGEQVYRDGIDISPEQFYERLPHTTPLPSTSQPSVGDFATVYQGLVNRGATAIVSIHLSEGISGTINSATQAAKQVDVPVEIVDTRCAAAAHLLVVETAVRALESQASLEDVLAAVRRAVEQQRTLFLVDTLEYLYKGGRIGGAAALVGSLLQFKPLLYFKEGKVDVLERVRKSSRALARLVEVMQEWVGTEPASAIVMHADAAPRAQAVADLLKQHLPLVDLRIVPLTPVVGAHVGNGTIGVCCCPRAALGLDADGATRS